MDSRRLVVLSLLGLCACGGSPAVPGSSASGGVQALAGPGAPSGLAYSQGRPTVRAGRAIPPLLASVSGTNLTFSVQPPLPAGLGLDPATGTISGTPAAAAATTIHQVSAANGLGSTSVNLALTVLPFANELEPASAGEAASVRLVRAVWGRLVDVYDRDPVTQATRLVARDLLVREDVATGGPYVVTRNLVLQTERVTIQAPLGTSAFADAYDALQANLPVLPALAPDAVPPFGLVPRNAAIALVFDDLVDPASITAETVRVLVGSPAIGAQSARLAADPNHGNVTDRDGDGRLEFWPTRVLVDPVVTEFEALDSALPIVADPDGFPASTSAGETNLLVRVPTIVDPGAGQSHVLRNLAGRAVSAADSAPFDAGSPTQDVVRALRSGGPGSATGDAFDGFLHDLVQPRLVAEIPAAVVAVQPDAGGNPEDRRVDVRFASAACAGALTAGDVVQIGATVLEVLAPSANPVGDLLTGVRVKILRRTDPLVGPATVHVRPDGFHGPALACALAFDPPALVAPADGVDPAARVALRSDEPLARASLSAMDETRITRVPLGLGGREIVPAAVEASSDLRGLALRPLVRLAHQSGASESYHVRVSGWRDLAGNPMLLAFPDVPFRLDPAASTVTSGGVTFVFDSNDMLPGTGAPPDAGSGKPEFRGQFLLDQVAGTLRGRPVTRFQAVADRTQAVPAAMVPLTTGIGTPVNRFGSKLQALWRYCDVGFPLLDESLHNVDVEHLYWAPVGPVVADAVTRYEIGLAHANKLPDESVGAAFLPNYPQSGLVPTYAQNVLEPLVTVHPGAHGTPGYVVSPADTTTTATGTTVVPWPLNRGLPLDRYERFTWRDTAVLGVGGALGPGAELAIVNQVGTPSGPVGSPYGPGAVPTIGLPLLMEFRCYPDTNTGGLNSFDVSIAVPSTPRPNFRAFSAGGVNTTGSVVFVEPDLANVATGGFNPTSVPSPGAATLPMDNTFLLGAADLVVRVSRSHAVWIDAGAPASWAAAVEPADLDQPAGSSIEVAYRGATAIAQAALTHDATQLGPYGDALSGAQPTFQGGDGSWSSSVASENGSRFVQMRVTFVSNAATGATSALQALGLAWQTP